VDDGPIALGGITDVWEGTYDDKKAAVKHWRIPLNDNQTLEKVRVLCSMLLSRLPKNACGLCSHSFFEDTIMWR